MDEWGALRFAPHAAPRRCARRGDVPADAPVPRAARLGRCWSGGRCPSPFLAEPYSTPFRLSVCLGRGTAARGAHPARPPNGSKLARRGSSAVKARRGEGSLNPIAANRHDFPRGLRPCCRWGKIPRPAGSTPFSKTAALRCGPRPRAHGPGWGPGWGRGPQRSAVTR